MAFLYYDPKVSGLVMGYWYKSDMVVVDLRHGSSQSAVLSSQSAVLSIQSRPLGFVSPTKEGSGSRGISQSSVFNT